MLVAQLGNELTPLFTPEVQLPAVSAGGFLVKSHIGQSVGNGRSVRKYPHLASPTCGKRLTMRAI